MKKSIILYLKQLLLSYLICQAIWLFACKLLTKKWNPFDDWRIVLVEPVFMAFMVAFIMYNLKKDNL
jgi:hypothetical protein